MDGCSTAFTPCALCTGVQPAAGRHRATASWCPQDTIPPPKPAQSTCSLSSSSRSSAKTPRCSSSTAASRQLCSAGQPSQLAMASRPCAAHRVGGGGRTGAERQRRLVAHAASEYRAGGVQGTTAWSALPLNCWATRPPLTLMPDPNVPLTVGHGAASPVARQLLRGKAGAPRRLGEVAGAARQCGDVLV